MALERAVAQFGGDVASVDVPGDTELAVKAAIAVFRVEKVPARVRNRGELRVQGQDTVVDADVDRVLVYARNVGSIRRSRRFSAAMGASSRFPTPSRC